MAGIFDIERVCQQIRGGETTAYWNKASGQNGEPNEIGNQRRLGYYNNWPPTQNGNGGWFHGSNWRDAGRINNANLALNNFFRAPYGWGECFQAAGFGNVNLNRATSCMVQFGRHMTFIFRANGEWSTYDDVTTADGGFFNWGYGNDAQFQSDKLTFQGKICARPNGDYQFHTFFGNRVDIPDPQNIRHVLTIGIAKLVVPTGRTDDTGIARYCYRMGKDLYYNNANASIAFFAPIQSAPDIGAGYFDFVTTEERLYASCTMTEAEFRANYPPIFAPGSVTPPAPGPAPAPAPGPAPAPPPGPTTPPPDTPRPPVVLLPFPRGPSVATFENILSAGDYNFFTSSAATAPASTLRRARRIFGGF